ncbi:MAG: hypothetical protein MRJ65_09955 [Candidatus Brocadiaceae bacterium]|nr:hypothetical protein [Candidatus Brocadiaceae bacterium]
MPDDYIIYREKHKNNGASTWYELCKSLSKRQKEEFENIVHENKFNKGLYSKHKKVNTLLSHYKRLKI